MGCGVKLIYYMQEFFVSRDIRHRAAIMRKTDIAFGIDHAVQRHASQFEEVDFLSVESGNRMIRVGQADEGDVFVLPVLLENVYGVGADRQNLRAATGEFFILVTQARQLRAAVRSHEAAQESDHDRSAAKIRQADAVALHIGKLKLRSQFPRRDQFRHWLISFKNRTVAFTTCFCCSRRVIEDGLSPG